MSRFPLRVYAAALLLAALGYAAARLVRGPQVGWGGPALVAWLTFAQWTHRTRAARQADGPRLLG
jgi:hypothetical protein